VSRLPCSLPRPSPLFRLPFRLPQTGDPTLSVPNCGSSVSSTEDSSGLRIVSRRFCPDGSETSTETLHKTCKYMTMWRTLSGLLLLGGILAADDLSDRKAIDAVIVSVFNPQVRSDPRRMAKLTGSDFDGNLDLLPVRTVWCETNCESYRVHSVKLVTTDVAVVDGESTVGNVWVSRWLMVLKRDAPIGWRISLIRSFGPSPLLGGNRLAGN
jgi:hypothetical protein